MNLVERVKNILLSPVSEWEAIKGETHTVSGLFTQYAMILAAIPALAGLIGFSLIGSSFGFGTLRLPIGYGLAYCVTSYILSLVGIYILAIVIDRLSPNFGASQDMAAALKIAVFSMTPYWIGGIFMLIPALSIITMIAGLYGLYLLFLGIKQLKDVPPEKLMTFFIISIMVAIVIQIVINTVVNTVAFPRPVL
ncbi:MAG TPA: Yip1 family protein [Syntrophales bacterium]|nr:Yip1 family protein [Syntrophales bacterium]